MGGGRKPGALEKETGQPDEAGPTPLARAGRLDLGYRLDSPPPACRGEPPQEAPPPAGLTGLFAVGPVLARGGLFAVAKWLICAGLFAVAKWLVCRTRARGGFWLICRIPRTIRRLSKLPRSRTSAPNLGTNAPAAPSRSTGPTSSQGAGLGSEGHAPGPYAAAEFPPDRHCRPTRTGSINAAEP